MTRWRESLGAFRAAFANRSIRRLELGWAGANIGTWAYVVAVSVFAYEHGGAKAVGFVGFGRWGAAALVAPWLGLLGDRFPRRRVMVGADLVRAAALGLAAAAAWLGWTPLVVYVLTAVVAAAASAFHPAEAALRPSLARSPDELAAANVASSSIAALGSLGGPALGGVLLAASGPGTVFAVSAAFLLWSAALVLSIRVREPEPVPPADVSVVRQALAGFTTILGDARLRLVMGLFGAQLLVNGMVVVLVVVVAERVVGLGSAGVGWLNAALGVGGVIGAFVAALLVGRRRVGGDFALGLLLFGAPLALLAALPDTLAAFVLLGVVGVGETVVDVAGMTLLQRIAPEDVLARVFAVFETIVLLTLGIGSLLAPALIALAGTRGALLVTGALLPVLLVLGWSPLAVLDRSAAPPVRELELLRAIPIFAPLASPELERLASALAPVEVQDGAAVVTAGETGDRFYVVDAGRCAVEVDGRASRELGPGEFFGEIALLRDVPRTATVRALQPTRLYALDRATFVAAVTGHRRSAEVAERVVGARLARA